jgi:hypothetical protein
VIGVFCSTCVQNKMLQVNFRSFGLFSEKLYVTQQPTNPKTMTTQEDGASSVLNNKVRALQRLIEEKQRGMTARLSANKLHTRKEEAATC